MSTENLKVVITGDASGLDKTSAGAQKALENISGTAQQMQKRLDDLIAKERSLLRATNNTFNPELLAKYNKALAEVRNQMNPIAARLDQLQANTNKVVPAANHAATGFYGLSRSANQANFAMVSLAQGIGDIPYGFSAIANNIQQTVQAFTYLKRTSGSTGSALKTLGATLAGPTGLFVGVSVVSAIITELVQKYGSLGNAMSAIFGDFNAAKQGQEALNKAYEGSNKTLADTIKNVVSLKEQVKLANEGYINGDTVIKKYNYTLGKTAGAANSLSDVEQKLIDHGNAIIELTLKKAVAQNVLAQATKEQATAQINAANGYKNLGGFFNNIWSGAKSILGSGGVNPLADITKQITDPIEKTKTFFDLYKKLLKDAADYAKKNGLNLFGGDGGKGLKTISDLLAEIQTKFKSVDTLAAGLGQSQEQIATEKIKILYDYIQKIADIGGPGAVKAIKDIVNQANQIHTAAFLPVLSGGRAQVNAPSGIGNINVPTTVQGQPGNLGTSKDTIKALNEQFRDTVKTGRELEGVFENIFSSIAQGENPFQALIQTIEQLIIKLLAAAAAAAVLNALTGGGAAGFGAIFGQLSGLKGLIPSHAQGGYIPGPQLAIVGDAPGGEWVLNQRQISAILNGTGRTANIPSKIELIAKGSDLHAVINTQSKIISRRT